MVRSTATPILLLALCAPETSASPGDHRACDGAHAASPWCDATKPRPDRIKALVAELTTAEKATLLSNTAQAVPRLGLPAYDWWNEAVHGFARVQFINGRCDII
jgi:beta-glucosidase